MSDDSKNVTVKNYNLWPDSDSFAVCGCALVLIVACICVASCSIGAWPAGLG